MRHSTLSNSNSPYSGIVAWQCYACNVRVRGLEHKDLALHAHNAVTCIHLSRGDQSSNSTDPRFRLLNAGAPIDSRYVYCGPYCSTLRQRRQQAPSNWPSDGRCIYLHSDIFDRVRKRVERPLQNGPEIRAVSSSVLTVDITGQKAAITGRRMRDYYLGIGLCTGRRHCPSPTIRLYPNRNYSTPGAKSGAGGRPPSVCQSVNWWASSSAHFLSCFIVVHSSPQAQAVANFDIPSTFRLLRSPVHGIDWHRVPGTAETETKMALKFFWSLGQSQTEEPGMPTCTPFCRPPGRGEG